MTHSDEQAPAGWYPDGAPGWLRWWDGTQWTEHRAPEPAAPGPGLPTASSTAVSKAQQRAAAQASREAARLAAAEQSTARKAAAAEKLAAQKAVLQQKRVSDKHARELAKANKGFEKRHSEWASLCDEAEATLQAARTLQPTSGEYFRAPAELIEQRAGKATYQAGSAGVSIPIGAIGGHSVRYRVGATRGHITRADPEDKVIDSGSIVVTTKGINFIGDNQTRVSDFAKMVNLNAISGEIRISVSNRQKATRIRPQASQLHSLILAASVAQADADSSRSQLVRQLEAEIKRIYSEEPRRLQ